MTKVSSNLTILICLWISSVSSLLSRQLMIHEKILSGQRICSSSTSSIATNGEGESLREGPQQSFFYSKKDFESIGLNSKVMGGVLNALNLGKRLKYEI